MTVTQDAFIVQDDLGLHLTSDDLGRHIFQPNTTDHKNIDQSDLGWEIAQQSVSWNIREG